MKVLLRLLSFLKPFFKEVSLSVLIGVATIGAGIGMLGTSAFLISTAALHPSIADIQVAIVGVRFFGISRGIFRYLERLVSHSVNLKVLTRLRIWFYEGAEKAAPAGMQTVRGGDLLNRVMADLETLENFYVRVVSPILVAFIVTVGMSLFLGGYFFPLGMILAAGMIMNGLVLPAFSILFTRKTGSQMQRTRAALSADMLETFQGLEDLQAAGAEKRWLQKVEIGSQKVGKIQQYYGFLSGLNNGLVLLVANLTLLCILIAAIPQVSAGEMSGVSLAVVSLLTMASFEATNNLPQAAQNLTASIASALRLFELVIPQQQNRASALALALAESTIQDARKVEIRCLSFQYPGSERETLHDINLTINKGQITALVGPSGSGKTSLLNILMRFWDYSAGEILVEGDDLREFTPISTRKLFGVISQSSYFFAETIRQNLLLANENASDEQLIEAIKKAELAQWFAALPEGLDTWLGEQGMRMSGGEAQRLAIARVLLQETPFILLDEPTSHLDPDTEKNVLATLFKLFSDSGVLLITHHLVMLDQVNEIVYLSDGKVVERGEQAELIKKEGYFYRYWQLQQNSLLADQA
jgi:ATP-binding cassette subfamily C protein CydC